MEIKNITGNLYTIACGMNTGALITDGRALLFGCCDLITPELLREHGVLSVDIICCTSYRRSLNAGIYNFNAKVFAPAEEAELFTGAEDWHKDPKHRWHLYDMMPDADVLPLDVRDAVPVRGGDFIDWNGYTVAVNDTKGATAGGISYTVTENGKRCTFCGDLIYGAGMIYDLAALQGVSANGQIRQYHGFIESWHDLMASLRTLLPITDILIPAHGEVIGGTGGQSEIRQAVDLLEERFSALYKNYFSISSINHYFGHMLKKDTSGFMKSAKTLPFPEYIKSIGYTSNIIISADKSAFLIDCGHDIVFDQLESLQKEGIIDKVEGCWITHYHDDHVDSADKIPERLDCPVYTSDVMDDIIKNPTAYRLPCISPSSSPAIGLPDGYTWQWHEFTLTALRLPGQSLYHGGLLVEGYGEKVFFAGDSGSPTGIDDYCIQNRNFGGEGRGSRRTLDIFSAVMPDYIINEHQDEAFCYSKEDIAFMTEKLEEREHMYAQLLPWKAHDFGLDELWARVFPFEQTAAAGSRFSFGLQFTNHAYIPLEVRYEIVGYDASGSVVMPARTCGICGDQFENPDISECVPLVIETPGDRVIPVRIWLDGIYLGQIIHGIVHIV